MSLADSLFELNEDLPSTALTWEDVAIKGDRVAHLLLYSAAPYPSERRRGPIVRAVLRDYEKSGREWRPPYHSGGARAWVIADVAFDQRASY